MRKRFLLLIASLLTIAQGTVAQGIAYVDRSWDDAAKHDIQMFPLTPSCPGFIGGLYSAGNRPPCEPLD